MKTTKTLKSFSHKELKEYTLTHINSNDSNKSLFMCAAIFVVTLK